MPTTSQITSLLRSKRLHYALAAILPVVIVALVGTLATLPNLHWYGTLRRPSFRPPTWVFGPAWSVLYAMMAYAVFRVLKAEDWMPDRPAAISAYWLQLGLNAAWPIVFFALHGPRLALAVMLALLVAVIRATRLFGLVDRTAGLYLVPYLIWLVFAALLNLSVAIRN